MKPTKVTLLAAQLGMGGAEQQLFYFLAGIDRERWHPTVVNFGNPADYWCAPIAALGVCVTTISRQGGRIARLARVVRTLRRDKPHFVHSWMWHLNPYAATAVALGGARVAVGSMRESFEGLPTGWLLRALGYRGLDALVVNSRAAAEDVTRRRLVHGIVRVVPNGVPIRPANHEDRERARAELGLAPGDLAIGTIGRMVPVKNQTLLVDAVAAIVPRCPEARLVIVGDGPCRDAIAQRAVAQGIASRTILPGACADAARYLPAFDIFCLTSLNEGMPNTVLEAMAAKIPVAGTACVSEVIEHGVSGLVVEQSAGDLAEALGSLASSHRLRQELADAAFVAAVERFSVTAMVASMCAAYEEAFPSARTRSA